MFERMTKSIYFILLLFFGATLSFASIDTIDVDVGISVFKTMPIGVVPFAEGSGNFSNLDERPHEVMERDLDLSGRFTTVSSPKFDLVKFSRERAKFYVTGRLDMVADGRVKLSCYLYASQTKDLLLGEAYTVPLQEIRRAVHHFVDKVIKQLWGEQGVASTQLVWVSKIDKIKQVVVADYDGFNRRQVTHDTSISMMPVWSLGNESVIYVNFRNGKSQLFQRNLRTGREKRLFPYHDQTFSPAVNPVTGEILYAVVTDSKTDLYLGNPETNRSSKISYSKASQVSPAWSPYASEILFSSDRGGSPQIYVMGKDGSDVRRVTFMGRYNERASWSPGGDRIVYTSMDGGQMNIYTCAIDGSDITQLTSNAGNNEHPTWSPDGMLIAFSSDRSGSHQIYIMRKDGSNVTRITNGGDNTSPTWSWYGSKDDNTLKKEGK
jgi:TolB protein